MPTINAIAIPVPGYVYVETNWADVPTATSVCVERVDTATGASFPLRPYVSYSADGCLDLSCGVGIFWDTEVPFDTEVQYCATVTDAAGNVITTPPAPLLVASFSTVAVASWPPADTGQVFTNIGGAAGDYSGTGTRGQHSVTTVNVNRMSSAPLTTPNCTATVTAFPTVLATGDLMTQELAVRTDAAGANGYRLRARYFPSGNIDLVIQRVVGGVTTSISAGVVVMTYAAATGVAMEFAVHGSQLRGRIWDVTTPVPAAYQVTATDATFNAVAGRVALMSSRSGGNTNGTVNFQWDNLLVTDVCAEAGPLEVCSNPVTVVGDGCFRLGDPVRPCSDRHVCLSEESDCSEEEVGIYFGTMSPGKYADNSGQMLPVNARRPVVVSRERRDVQSQLVLVTRTFDDRDDLLLLNEPGTPLLWRGPASYGTGDRYMSVLDVDLSQSFLDLQEEPRVAVMPHWATDPPVGPSLGVCGTRVDDLCDVYPTWDAVAADGLTYADLLRGAAGTGVSVDLATWNDVNADFASWNALNAAEADWVDVWQGFP
jgi:hypothetical protein